MLKVINMSNLSPSFDDWEYVLRPGQHKLITFNIVDIEEPMNYAYKLSSNIEESFYKEDSDFPFLPPFPEGTVLKTEGPEFLTGNGETIHAVRKGRVTAISEEKPAVDRISPFFGIEVRHSDGTMAIYINEDMSDLVEPGQFVYAGQPLAKIASESDRTLELEFLHIIEDGRAKEFAHVFQSGGKKYAMKDLDGIQVEYDEEVATLELSSKEEKKYKKGKLF
jgi:hypothetical protein